MLGNVRRGVRCTALPQVAVVTPRCLLGSAVMPTHLFMCHLNAPATQRQVKEERRSVWESPNPAVRVSYVFLCRC